VMRVLDIDLDVFVQEPVYSKSSRSERVDAKEHQPWPRDAAIASSRRTGRRGGADERARRGPCDPPNSRAQRACRRFYTDARSARRRNRARTATPTQQPRTADS
jgi:hypothetical protein